MKYLHVSCVDLLYVLFVYYCNIYLFMYVYEVNKCNQSIIYINSEDKTHTPAKLSPYVSGIFNTCMQALNVGNVLYRVSRQVDRRPGVYRLWNVDDISFQS